MADKASLDQKPRQFAMLLIWISAIVAALVYLTTPHDVKEVSLRDAKALIEGGAIVLDVRNAKSFSEAHVPGARSIPLAVLSVGIPEALAFAKNLPIVVYCADGVNVGPKAAALLKEAGYTNVVSMREGAAGWKSAGLPMTKVQ